MTPRRPFVRRDDGFVLVPVVILMVIALGLGFALLAVVDTQSAQSADERAANASQTLAEGVVAAAGNVVASDQSATTWPTLGGCRTYTHRLSEIGGTADLESKIVKEVHDRFAGTSTDLTDIDARQTTWTLNLCPVAGSKANASDASWSQDAATWNPTNLPTAQYLQTTITSQPSGTAPVALSMWARGQANVRVTSSTSSRKSRAVVTKLRQTATTFRPTNGLALSTGSLSTDVTTTLSSTLFNDSSLVGGLTGGLLGTRPLIDGGSTAAQIGTRCSLVGALNLGDAGGACLSGTLSGVNSLTKALTLGQLNNVLGTSSQTALNSWAMAPPDALAAYAAAAKRQGNYVAGGTTPPSSDPWTITGYGQDDATIPNASPVPAGSAGDCVPPATLAAATKDTVIYIKQVGNGEQYCTLRAGTVGIIVVERGAMRVVGSGTFHGVVYGANLQECGDDGVCTNDERKAGATHPREVVRIDGGTVSGAVWADGAGGRTGVYPPKLGTLSTSDILVSTTDPNSPCAVPVGLTGAVSSLTTGLGTFLGGTLNFLAGSYYTLPDGSTQTYKPDACQLLKIALTQVGKTEPEKLAQLLIDGGKVTVTVAKHSCVVLGAICTDSSSSTDVTIPAGTTISNTTGSGPTSVLGGIVGLLTSTITTPKYQAIVYNAADAGLSPAAATGSTVTLPQGAAPVIGTYRNVPSL
jgi:hypothetical protein